MSAQRLDTTPSREDRDNASFLSPVAYDDDASSLHSRSDQDTDTDDDELISRARNSRELRAHDRIVLVEEDDIDRLVTDSRQMKERDRRGSGLAVPQLGRIFSRRGSNSGTQSVNSSTDNLVIEKRNIRRQRRQKKRDKLVEHAHHGEDGELMYEMEEGGMKEGSSTGESSERDDSDELDRHHLNLIAEAKAQRRRSWRRWVFIHSLIAIGFAILILLAWKLSKNRKSRYIKVNQKLVSNGTALFAPTSLIISLDGFRADFLQRGLTPTLNSFVAQGVSPKWMHPSFPSVTFPNHYTLATGLYPESHGIVSNTFWDPELQSQFYYTHPAQSLDPKWWGGEPFWVTAEKQGVRSAVHMWPGSEAHVLHTEPSLMDKFNGKETLDNKVSRIMEFLDMPGLEDKTVNVNNMRPQLIAAYVPHVDSDGHKFGPNSTEIRQTIQKVDGMLGEIFHGLEERNLTNIVNVIIVSDHGMATTDISRLIQLEDLIDMDKIEHIDGWPLYGLRPKDPDDLKPLYDQLKKKAKSNPNFQVYLRDVDMPERYHFSKHPRIAPLWVVPETGWAIVTKEEFDVKEGKKNNLVYHPRGLHGYDHEHPLMRAIFIARGPAFPHPANSQIDVFQNIEVYNMLCDSVGLTPSPNNGTLRLPLKPVGVHQPEDTPEEPEDPPTALKESARPTVGEKPHHIERPTVPQKHTQPERPTVPIATSGSTKTTISLKKPVKPSKTAAPSKDGGDKHEDSDSDSDSDDDDDKDEDIWDWFTHKVEKVWHKITGDD
ncbi:ectonucleotide pyrophosphatase phosphodiesterase [Fusarium heterosporum]|uniref:Ectonucleotide pyrophosphatase phosphodiesterase n=1 Tax=Fusarium heterosporum TaxID=42747 RepID=A0A8H5SS96_FUSHE|nr:ectonucleotide pyrophosphatase phosphodiesterase [Fusarium heterosporum]